MGNAVGFQFDHNIVFLGDETANSKSIRAYDLRNATFNNNLYWAANSASAAALQSQVSQLVRVFVF